MDGSWCVYVIEHEPTGATYVGVSPDPVRRLRQHNGEIVGGAKYTTSKSANGVGGWRHVCLVRGFREPREALQFEWAVKHVAPRKTRGIDARMQKLATVLGKERWTSNAPLASEVPLTLEIVSPLRLSAISCFSALPEYVILLQT
jgi:structure-specific endonuclease subunit SLX1